MSRRRAERGGVAALVAVLLAMGSLLGFAAIAVDVGNVMVERREVQNGADASAMALAGICAESPVLCTNAASTPTNGSLGTLNDLNAKDLANGFDPARFTTGACGVRLPTGAALDACTSLTEAAATAGARAGQLRECLRVPGPVASNPAVSYVELYTRTRTTSGNELPSFVSQAVFGSNDTTVNACARAAWGPAAPDSRNVLNITMSECDWKTQTGYTGPGTATYPAGPQGPNPGYGTTVPWPATETKVYTQGNPTTCDTSAPGGTAARRVRGPGRRVLVPEHPHPRPATNKLWAKGDPGSDLPCSEPQLDAMRGTVVSIPIFDCQTNAIVTVDSDARTAARASVPTTTTGSAASRPSTWPAGKLGEHPNQPSIRPPFNTACFGGDRASSAGSSQDVVPDQPLAPRGRDARLRPDAIVAAG